MTTLTLLPRGPYSLAESRRFACGFTPAAGSCSSSDRASLTMGFLLDGTFEPAAVTLRDAAAGAIAVSVHEGDATQAAAQASRIVSLDHDATGFATVVGRDPALAPLLAARAGFRPVCFASPYEAGLWGILAQRTSMAQAASVKRALAEGFGTRLGGPAGAVEATGDVLLPPSPRRLLDVRAVAGLPEEKLRRLHGLARAALDGWLEATVLRAMPEDEARARLGALHGVGPWTAEHLLLRGAAVRDVLPVTEPRVLVALGSARGLGRPATKTELVAASAAWSGFRTWASVLLVSSLGFGPPRSRGAAPRRARAESAAEARG